MRDATFIQFVEDYNEFKRVMSRHLSLTDYRDFETNMYMKAIYSILIKIPLFRIFFQHQMLKVAKRNFAEQKNREEQQKAIIEKIKAEKKTKEFGDKIAV